MILSPLCSTNCGTFWTDNGSGHWMATHICTENHFINKLHDGSKLDNARKAFVALTYHMFTYPGRGGTCIERKVVTTLPAVGHSKYTYRLIKEHLFPVLNYELKYLYSHLNQQGITNIIARFEQILHQLFYASDNLFVFYSGQDMNSPG